ncbi:MAG TPA: hypothetical protein VND99_02860 [Candidatus Acidoferrales bacterium]|nr:hypothetical protein [Candidatus Acidoferrales bacterium]
MSVIDSGIQRLSAADLVNLGLTPEVLMAPVEWGRDRAPDPTNDGWTITPIVLQKPDSAQAPRIVHAERIEVGAGTQTGVEVVLHQQSTIRRTQIVEVPVSGTGEVIVNPPQGRLVSKELSANSGGAVVYSPGTLVAHATSAEDLIVVRFSVPHSAIMPVERLIGQPESRRARAVHERLQSRRRASRQPATRRG